MILLEERVAQGNVAGRRLYGPPVVRPSVEEINTAITNEEHGYMTLAPDKISSLERDRLPILGALHAAELSILHQYIPADAGCVVEMGAAQSFMYRHVLDDSLKSIWNPFEINTFMVAGFRESNPDIPLEWGSVYRPLRDIEPGTVDAWVGHSSYDSISFLEVALQNTYQHLKPGGLFIHIQDVSPSSDPPINYVEYALGNRDMKVLEMWNMCGGGRYPTRDGKEIFDLNKDLSERLLEAMERAGFGIVCSGPEIGVSVGPAQDRHTFVTGGVKAEDNYSLILGPEKQRQMIFYLWDRGKHVFSDELHPDKPPKQLSDFFKTLEELAQVHDLSSGNGFFAPRQTVKARSFRYSPGNPIEIYSEKALRRAGFVQEIFIADVIIGRKE